MICRFRDDGTLTFVNDAYCQRFERTRESLIGTNFVPYIPDEDLPLIDNLLAALSPDMEPYTHEHRTIFPNGETRWHQWTNIAVKDDQGRFLEYQAIGRDITQAKAVASELEESLAKSAQLHDRLLEAVESFTDGFALYDADDRLVICNSRYWEIYDISADLLVPGVKFEDHVRASAYRGQIADAIGREEEWVRERVEQHQEPQGTYLQKLGNGRWLEIREQKTRDGGIVGVRTDITERKNAEDALRLFRALIDQTSDFVEVIDPATGRFLDVNQRACDAHGYTREEYLALSVPEIDPQVGKMGWEAVHAEIRKVDRYVLETSHRRKDGSILPVEVSCNHVMLDREYLLANVRDITERKQAEAALRESEQRYKTIFQSAPDALFVISAAGENAGMIVAANEEAAQSHGYTIDELIGMPISQIDTPESAELIPARLARLAAGERLTFEVEHRRKDGSTFPVEVTAERVLLDGHPHVLAFDRDITDRKRTEAALRESEERYKTIFESAPDAVYVIAIEDDKAGRIVAANRLAAQLHDREVDEIVGMPASDLDSVASAEDRPQRLRRILSGERLTFEINKRRRDGTEFPVEVTAEKVMLDGQAHVLAFGRDISARKQAEEQLRESQERLQLAVEATQIGAWDWNIATGEVIFAPEWKRQLGYEDDEIESHVREWESRLHPDDQERVGCILQDYLARRTEGYATEFRLQHKDGSYRWIYTRGSAVFDAQGQPERMLGCHLDITERKEAEDALRQSEQKLAAIAATMPEVLYVFDLKTYETIFTNRELWEDLGYTREQAAQSKAFATEKLLHPDDLAMLPERLRRWEFVQDKDVVETEYRMRHASGQWRWYLSRDTVYRRDDQGCVTQVIGTAQDITQRKQAEQERQALEAQMLQSQKLESLGVLAGGIAHDFNNLLSVILNYTSVLELKLPKDVPARPMVGEIEKAARRAGDLTRQMLAYAGKATFVIEPLRLDLLVREMANLLESVVASNATIEMNLQPAVIDGDVTQIRQVVMNLLTNASDALLESPGTIRLLTGVRHMESPELQSSFTTEDLPAGEYAYVIVSDDGSGMNDEVLQRIFDPFFSTKFNGRGLGLAAVLGILRGHRGTIRVESAENQGTEFALYFPAGSA